MVYEPIKARYRLCVDFTSLNKVLAPTALGAKVSIDDTLEKLKDHKFYASFDYKSAFMQRLVHEDSRYLLTMSCPDGLYE